MTLLFLEVKTEHILHVYIFNNQSSWNVCLKEVKINLSPTPIVFYKSRGLPIAK